MIGGNPPFLGGKLLIARPLPEIDYRPAAELVALRLRDQQRLAVERVVDVDTAAGPALQPPRRSSRPPNSALSPASTAPSPRSATHARMDARFPLRRRDTLAPDPTVTVGRTRSTLSMAAERLTDDNYPATRAVEVILSKIRRTAICGATRRCWRRHRGGRYRWGGSEHNRKRRVSPTCGRRSRPLRASRSTKENTLPIIAINMNDSPARTDPEEAAIGRPTATARRLVEASVSPNTRRAYAGALRRLDAWLDGRELDDAALAAYLAELHDAGRASSSASMAVAAACFRAKLAGQPTPAGERTARVLAGYRRTAGDRGRGQARPFGVSDLAAVLATCHRPRRRGRGVESEEVALERGRLDAVIAGLLFMAGMRRSEVSALRWADVVDSTAGDGVLVTVRRSKTNQEGEVNDVRFVKDGVARALRMLRAAMSPEPSDRVVPLSAQMIGLRFTAAAQAAGVECRVTAHSGRVGLASELTSRGASTTDVMLAGNWKTSRMVAHYSAGATAERGAVARYL